MQIMHCNHPVDFGEQVARPVVLGPDTMLREAAQKMRELDSGVMPVGESDRLVGMPTDRDVTVRATADGKDPNTTPVREVMTPTLTEPGPSCAPA